MASPYLRCISSDHPCDGEFYVRPLLVSFWSGFCIGGIRLVEIVSCILCHGVDRCLGRTIVDDGVRFAQEEASMNLSISCLFRQNMRYLRLLIAHF